VDRVAEAERLVILAGDISKDLMDLGMSPIPGIPRDPCAAGDILEVADVILEPLREAYSFVDIASVIQPTLLFCFVFILFLDVRYSKDSVSPMFLFFWACRHNP
jgi:hypothetical protein